MFIVIEGITAAGVIDAVAGLFYKIAGDSPFLLFTLIVFASVILSAFIDNIPYVATMLPVVQSIALLMNGGAGMDPNVFYFGLLTGATLGGIFGSFISFNTEGLDFAMTAMFVVIFLEQLLKEKNHLNSALGIFLPVVSLLIFGKDKFIIPAMLMIFAALLLLRKPLEKGGAAV